MQDAVQKCVIRETKLKKKKSLPASWPALLGNSSCLSGPDMLTALFKGLKAIHVHSNRQGAEGEAVLIV